MHIFLLMLQYHAIQKHYWIRLKQVTTIPSTKTTGSLEWPRSGFGLCAAGSEFGAKVLPNAYMV